MALAMALEDFHPGKALYFDYDQRARLKEHDAAGKIAGHYGLRLERVELPWLGRISSSALITGGNDLPRVVGLDGEGGAVSRIVWVENRNGIFINIAAAYAAAGGCGTVIVGFNREEAVTFPDNSEEFLESVNDALAIGAGSPVSVKSPTISMDKSGIVQEGLRLEIPWNLLWSCYRGGRLMCGFCESCRRLKRALEGTPAEREVQFSKE